MVSKPTPQKTDNEIFSLLKAENKVKKVQGEIPFAKNMSLIDVSLKVHGAREDEAFSKSPFFRQTIRRGLSFLKPEGAGPQICRRGLQKFFDIRNEYLGILKGTTDVKSARLSWDDERLYHVIFDEAVEALKKGEKVVVYKSEKANGENAQVSYNAELNCWVVASKNVSIFVRNLADVKEYVKYGDKRYGFATLIAETWLKLIERVPDVEELKKELKGKTLIGEYCGNPKHQHLVEYSEITILFYALVEYQSDRSCLPIKATQDFLQKHNLPKVRMTPRKECENLTDFTDILTELAKEVSENTIEEDQEGTVLYFEVHTPTRVEILSLSKLKTLEYRLYRKLREKLKTTIQKGYTTSQQLKKYISEVEGLCDLYKPPKPLTEYYETARIALDFVSNNTDVARRLGISSRYIDFLKVIKNCQANQKKPEVADFQKILDAADELSDDSDLGDEGGREEEPKGDEKEEGKTKQEKGAKGKKGKKEEKEEEKKIETKDEGRKKGKKSNEEDNEVEEKKISDEKVKTAGKSEVDLPKRIVLITPPLYFDWDTRKKIVERASVAELESEYRESKPIEGKRSVVLLNRFPAVTKKTELEKNTVFLVAGFDQDTQKSTLKKLESLAQEKDRFQLTGTEFTYAQSKEKEKSLELLWTNSQKFADSIQQVLPNNYQILNLSKPEKILEEIDFALEKLKNFQSTLEAPLVAEPELKKEDSKPKTKKAGSQILVFIPIGIPGMGKTTFLNLLKKLLEEKGCEITIISSDKIRKQHIDEVIKRDPNVSEDKAFEKSAKPAKKQFFSDVEKAIEKTATLNKETHIIFLDKNHPPNIIQETIEFFDKPKYKPKYRIRTVILKPQCGENFRTRANIYPFSITFLLTCLRRAINRNEHETLKGDELKIAKVLVSFFNLYKGYKAREGDFKMFGANFLMELPFTNEDPEVEKQIPFSLTQSLQDVLHGLRAFDPDEEKVMRFLEELAAWKVELKNPDPNLLYQCSVDSLNKCFELFEVKRGENER